MNIFRFIADMLHLAAICTLLYRIKVSRNVVGKSRFFLKHLLASTTILSNCTSAWMGVWAKWGDKRVTGITPC